MIEIYEGRIGSGKTFHAVKQAMEYFVQGGTVCTNIRLNWDECRDWCRKNRGVEIEDSQYVYLEDEQVGTFHRYTPSGTVDCPVLVMIDEAHIWFNSRDWAHADREFLTFLTQSRHVFTDVLFISQSAMNCDKQIMRLVCYIWRHRDMRALHLFGLKQKWMQTILAVKYEFDGRTLIDRELVYFDRDIFRCYDSFANVRDFARKGTVKRKSIKRNKKKVKMKYIVVLCVLVAVVSSVVSRKYARREFRAELLRKADLIAQLENQVKMYERKQKEKKTVAGVEQQFVMPPKVYVSVVENHGPLKVAKLSNGMRVIEGSRFGGTGDQVRVVTPDGAFNRDGCNLVDKYINDNLRPVPVADGLRPDAAGGAALIL